ncbi:MAG: ATP-binding protein [Candidatus Binataceae bacterium]
MDARTTSPFVGRKRELELFADALSAASAGNGRLCLISGEVGIGKTRLLEQFVRESASAGFRIVRARFEPRGSVYAGLTWSRVLRDTLACGAADNSNSEPLTLTQWRQTNGPSAGQSPATFDSFLYLIDGEAVPAEPLAERVRHLLRQASAAGRCMIALDDLQNAGDASVAMMCALRGELRELPILIAGTIADYPASSMLQSDGWLGEHQRLGPLSLEETAECLNRSAESGEISAVVARVYAATGGNPGLIRELGEFLAAREMDADAVAGLSARSRWALEERLSALSPGTRGFLAVTAASGGDLSISVSGKAAGLDCGETHFAMGELERAGWGRSGYEGKEFRLTARIAGAVALAGLQPGERFAIHRRIAAELEENGGNGAGAHCGAIASHYLASMDPAMHSKAIAYAHAAGGRAMEAKDFPDAVRNYILALRAMDLGGLEDEAQRCELLIALAEARILGGDHLRAEEDLRLAAELAEKIGSSTRLADVVVRLPSVRWPVAIGPSGLALVLGARVCSSIGAEDSTVRAKVESRIAAETALIPGEMRRSEEVVSRGVEVMRKHADTDGLLSLLCQRILVLAHPERLPERLENGEQITRLALQAGDYHSLYLGYQARSAAFLELGDLSRADAEAELMLQAALMSREPAGQAMAAAYHAARAMMEGRFADGERAITESRRLGAGHDLLALCDLCWPALVMPRYEQGRLSELEEIAATCVGNTQLANGVYASMLSWLFLKLGKAGEAACYFERAADRAVQNACASDGYLASLAALAQVAAAMLDTSRAATLYQMLGPYAERNLTLGTVASFGSGWRYMGILAVCTGRLDEAIDHFGRALAFNRRIGGRPWAAYSGYELAEALVQRNLSDDRGLASGLIQQVTGEAESMGMVQLAGRAAAFQKRLGAEGVVSVPAVASDRQQSARAQVESSDTRHQETVGRNTSAPSAAALAHVQSNPAEDGATIFRREGDYWTLGYEAKLTRIQHRKGLTLIAHLLAYPRRDFHALELCALLDPHEDEIRSGGKSGLVESPDEPVLDARAKQSYRHRLRELREELEEARSHNDPMRAERIEQEAAYLTRELARAFGMHGRDRKIAVGAERARVRVTSVIRSAIEHVGRQHRTLGRFLATSITTGTYAAYTPIAEPGPDWQL